MGEGDAILVPSPERKAALVDAGPSKDVVALLRSRGVTALARRIIEGRPHGPVDELLPVKGIGEKRLAAIRASVTAR